MIGTCAACSAVTGRQPDYGVCVDVTLDNRAETRRGTTEADTG